MTRWENSDIEDAKRRNPDLAKLNTELPPVWVNGNSGKPVISSTDLPEITGLMAWGKESPQPIPDSLQAKSRRVKGQTGSPVPKESESAFQTWVLDYARLQGWMCHHTRPAITFKRGEKTYRTNIMGDPGFPDWVFARDGRVLFVELKSETGKLSDEQCAWLKSLEYQWNPDVYVWKPSQREDIMRILSGYWHE